MITGRDAAQAIHDWIVNYANMLAQEGNYATVEFSSFASTLQEMIDEGVYGE